MVEVLVGLVVVVVVVAAPEWLALVMTWVLVVTLTVV